MIEVTKIDKDEPKFVKGAYVNGKLVKEIEPEDNLVKDEIAAIIHDDIADLKAYEKSACCCECTTAIGAPKIGANVIKARQKVFDSGLKVINLHKDKVKIDIPKVILNICDELQEEVGRNEFSIVCKGKWGNDGNYLVSEEYFVPKQKVDGAAVDYDHDHLEQLKLEGFNVVIHSHPFKSNSFSSSDQETINSHFDCSILYSMREFTTATVLISNLSEVKMLATGDPHVEGENLVPKAQIDNIEKRVSYAYGGGMNYQDNWDNIGNFRGAGRGGNFRGVGSHIEAERITSARGRVAHLGNKEFTYDVATDTFYKNGKPVDDPYYRGKNQGRGCSHQGHGNQSQMIKVHTDGSCNSTSVQQIPRRVFTTETEVFNSGDSNKKKKGGKKDNQPKIDLP
jgi:hypothetical protein